MLESAHVGPPSLAGLSSAAVGVFFIVIVVFCYNLVSPNNDGPAGGVGAVVQVQLIGLEEVAAEDRDNSQKMTIWEAHGTG